MALYSVNWSAAVSPVAGTIVAGYCLVADSSGLYYVATSANRTSFGRTSGVAVTAGDSRNPVVFIEAGPVPASITGLGAGTASWVRVSTAGLCERCTPGAGDDIIGKCKPDGTLHLVPGVFDSTNYAGGSGGTTPTGTGVRKVVAGVENAAATTIVDADVSASAALAVSKLAPSGTNGWVLTTTAGVPVWSVASGGSTPTGTGIPHIVAGVQQGASSLIVNADVSASAAIALSKIVNPTGTGLVKTSGGVIAAAGATLVDADVNAAAAIAGTKVAPNFGSQNVVTTGAVSVGTSPATVGGVQLANATEINSRDPGNTTDITMMMVDSAGRLRIGLDGSFGKMAGSVFIFPSSSTSIGVGGSNVIDVNAANVSFYKPITGDGSVSPYGVHGGFSFAMAIASGSYTVTAAQFQYDHCEFTTGTLVGAFTTVWPAPASLAVGYYKTITNATTQTMTVSTGTGSTRTLATNLTQRFWFDSAGVQYASPTVTR